MKCANSPPILSAYLTTGVFDATFAETMDWVGFDQFDDAIWPYRERELQPADLAVRIVNGSPEYKLTWQERTSVSTQ